MIRSQDSMALARELYPGLSHSQVVRRILPISRQNPFRAVATDVLRRWATSGHAYPATRSRKMSLFLLLMRRAMFSSSIRVCSR
jgi:hypothetical protein